MAASIRPKRASDLTHSLADATRGRGARCLALVARQQRDHPVLELLYADRADAVLDEREDDGVAGGVKAVAAQGRDADERAGLRATVAAGRRAGHAVLERAPLAGCGQRCA